MNDQNHLKPRRVSRWWAVSCERLSSTRWLLVSYWTVSIRRMILQLDPPPSNSIDPITTAKHRQDATTTNRQLASRLEFGVDFWGHLGNLMTSDYIWWHLMTNARFDSNPSLIHPPKKINQFCALVRSRFVNSGLVHCAAQPLIDQGQTPCASRALLPVGAKVTKWIYASLCHFLGWFPLSCQKPGDEVTIMCPSCRRKKKLWSISRQPAT